jgi:hypothetical protein
MANTWYISLGNYLKTTLQGVYIGLILSNGVEVSGGSYARVQCNSLSVTEDSSYIYLTNSSAITYPIATADWATQNTYAITQIGLYDALTGGNLLGTYTLGFNKYCYNGDQVTIPVGSHKIYFTKSV